MIRRYRLVFLVLMIVFIFYLIPNLDSQEKWNDSLNVVNIEKDFKSINMRKYYKVLLSDDINSDLLKDPQSFIEIEDKSLNYGYTKNKYILTFKFITSRDFDEKLFLKFNFPSIDRMQLNCFNKGNDKLVKYSGTHVSAEKKIKGYRHQVFNLDRNFNFCFLEIISQESMQLESEIISESEYNQNNLNDIIFQSIFFGGILSLIIYNIFNYIFTKINNYLIFSFALINYLLFIFIYEGFESFLIWNKSLNLFSVYSLPFSVLLGVIFTLLFYISLYIKSVIQKKDYFFYKICLFVGIFLFFLSYFFQYYIYIQIVLFYMFISILFIFYMSFKYYSTMEILKYYLVSWFLFILGALVLSLKGFGVLSSNKLVDHSFHIGLFLQQILLSIIISRRIEIIRIETENNLKSIVEEKSLLYESEKKRSDEITKLNYEVQLTNERATKAYLELEASQKQLVRSDKMITLGTMVAGVAHEINTPLGAIKANSENISEQMKSLLESLNPENQNLSLSELQMVIRILELTENSSNTLSSKEQRALRKKIVSELESKGIIHTEEVAEKMIEMGLISIFEGDHEIFKVPEFNKLLGIASLFFGIQKKTGVIQISAERVSKIVKSLKSYMHFDQSEEKKMADLTEGMETVLIILHNKIKMGIEVTKNYGEDVPQILCFPDELNQVWTNLIHNAIQAMDEKGSLQIDIEKVSSQQGKPDIDKRNSNYTGEYISVSIQDSGSGISPEIRQKIFQAFFTTKPAGEGSGLGLHIIGKILEKHEGALYLESEPGRTRFSVVLPVGE